MERTTHATISPARYNDEARAEFVAYGLAVRTLGQFASGILLVSIDGAPRAAQRWIDDFGGDIVRPVDEQHEPDSYSDEPHEGGALRSPEMFFTHTTLHNNMNRERARGLVRRALESAGPDSLALANRAREIVGLDGLDEIAGEFADSGDVETAWTIRGAVDALTGASEPDEIGGAYESEALDGFDFVRAAGYGGAWSEHVS